MSDHYETLGVSRDATADEIKKAYRKLARKLHPDVSPGKEDEFKRVSHAYDVLSDPEKRRNYDLGGSANGTAGPGAGFGGFSDLFETFFGGGGGGAPAGPPSRTQRGQDALLHVRIPLRTAVFGGTEKVTVETAVLCETCRGECTEPGTSIETCPLCHGTGQVQRVARTLLGQMVTNTPCNHCHGFGTVIPSPCHSCQGEGRVRQRRELNIRIPAGVDGGNRIRLSGQGEVGMAGGPPGDIYVEFDIEQHEVFSRKGDDLHCTVTVPMTAAALGASMPIETFDGEQTLDIDAGAQSGETIVLPGLGVTHLRGQGRGDLKVRLQVATPGKLDAKQRELLEKLAELRGEAVPQAAMGNTARGPFSRLRERFAGR